MFIPQAEDANREDVLGNFTLGLDDSVHQILKLSNARGGGRFKLKPIVLLKILSDGVAPHSFRRFPFR